MIVLLAFGTCLGGGFLFPWWWPAVIGVAIGLWSRRRTFRILFDSALGAALAWGALSAFYHAENHELLGNKVSALFHLPNGWFLVAASALLGSVTAILGAATGKALRRSP
jgi:hypothetical protein